MPDPMPDRPQGPGLAAALAERLGPRGWLEGDATLPFRRDWLDRHGAAPLGVARPATTAEVAAVVGACHRAGIAVVPQGGNTGLVGGGVAGRADAVLLSLSRLAGIGAPDRESGTIEVGAGVVLSSLHAALADSGLMFPLHLGAEGSAQVGGLIGTNAGGSQAFRFGMMGDLVLGLEVVLPDGRVWNGLRAVQKDNAGYALRRLFCGSEGTLGVVTRAILRLAPAPRRRVTALLALPGFEALAAAGARLRAEAGDVLHAAEFLSDTGVGLALAHVPGLGFPLGTRAPAYLLVELACASDRVPLDDILADILSAGMEAGEVIDGTIASSGAQRAALWRLREDQPEGQRLAGPQLKHDISVPPGRIAGFVAAAEALCRSRIPEVRINPFGHLGDGNIHYNLSPPEGQDGFGGAAEALGEDLARLAQEFGGSFAAEHGLGRTKVALAERLRTREERALMAAIKRAIDPSGHMNPDVVVAADKQEKLS